MVRDAFLPTVKTLSASLFATHLPSASQSPSSTTNPLANSSLPHSTNPSLVFVRIVFRNAPYLLESEMIGIAGLGAVTGMME